MSTAKECPMPNNDEKMALWIAFTISNFTNNEIQTLSIALQTKLEELKDIVND